MGSLQDFEQRLENLYFKMTPWAVVLRIDSRKARMESGGHLRGPCHTSSICERVCRVFALEVEKGSDPGCILKLEPLDFLMLK